MAIPNVNTVTSRTDYDVRSHKSNSKDRNSKPHNPQAKPEQPSGENPRKEDTVTISEEGRKELFLGRVFAQRVGGSSSLGGFVNDPSLGLVFEKGDFSSGKLPAWNEVGKAVENGKWQRYGVPGTPEWEEHVINWQKAAYEEEINAARNAEINANQPSYADYSLTSVSHRIGAEEFILNSLDGKAGNASKEVANQLASMIFSTKDTDLETQAANREAARDLAKRIAETYMSDPKEAQAFIDEINKRIEDSELIDKGYVNSSKGLTPPDPMDDHDRFILANWDKYFGHLGISPKVNEFNKLDWNGSGVPIEEIGKALHSARKDFIEEALAHFQKVNTPQKFWPDGSEGPSWEEKKEMNTRYSMYNEENKAWYADFLAKSNLVQNIINNAKLITDFSGNERWNMVMNLLTAQQGDK